MAGIKLETLTEQLDSGRVVRAMPNTPAQIGRGVSVWKGGATVNAEDRELTRRILGAVGTEIEAPNESLVDAATAVHGSGPAYVYLVAEAWIDAAVAIGLDHATAETLVRETLAGSAQLWETTDRSPAELRHAVTSPAGTTAAALRVFEEQGLRTAFFDAVESAFLRSQELG
jgi:pyrroline-5-carboxylate reductase